MDNFNKWKVAPIMTLQFFGGIGSGIIATFYPIEASSRGISSAQYGAVFGIIHIALFIFGK